MGIATASHAQTTKPAPPPPFDEKKVELGGTPWNPQAIWDLFRAGVVLEANSGFERSTSRGTACRNQAALSVLLLVAMHSNRQELTNDPAPSTWSCSPFLLIPRKFIQERSIRESPFLLFTIDHVPRHIRFDSEQY
jgi:hypothetical protein